MPSHPRAAVAAAIKFRITGLLISGHNTAIFNQEKGGFVLMLFRGCDYRTRTNDNKAVNNPKAPKPIIRYTSGAPRKSSAASSIT
jgi:hypothetical protein